MSYLDTAMHRIRRMVETRMERAAPFRAIVTSVDGTTGMVTIRRLEAETAENELRARVGVGVVAENDEVLCLPVSGKPVVIGKVYRTSPPPAGSGGADWGDIGGTLADQTDLQEALDLKANATDLHSHANKAILDATEEAYTTAKDGFLSGLVTNAVSKTATSVSGWGWVIDEDNMTSDSATKVPTQQSVKAYVDANSGGGGSGHTHDNLEILDGMEVEYTTDKDNFLSGLVSNAVSKTATSVAGWGWILDEDDMSSDSATKIPTQQSVKAYVDANAGGGGGGGTSTQVINVELFRHDGGVIQTGDYAQFVVPWDCEIVRISAYADVSGNGGVEWQRVTHANYPPDSTDAISPNASPLIFGGTKSIITDFSAWDTTSLSADDIVRLEVVAGNFSNIHRVTYAVEVELS